ncbi:unnamed protein product, partial [Polarella glacialis]
GRRRQNCETRGVVLRLAGVTATLWEAFAASGLRALGKCRLLLIGTFSEVRQYMSLLVDEMAAHPSCHKKGVSGAINNFVAHGTHPGIQIHTYENRRGPVWTGANVPRSNVLADADNDLINEDGYKYAVLHQYDQHEELWKNLLKRFLKSRQQKLAVLDCSSFQMESGDLRGYDLSHLPADSEKECCVACLEDTGCGAFIFSAGR